MSIAQTPPAPAAAPTPAMYPAHRHPRAHSFIRVLAAHATSTETAKSLVWKVAALA